VVYNLSNDRAALAQSFMNATRSNVVEIARNASGVPLATGQPEVALTAVPKPKDNGAGAVMTRATRDSLGMMWVLGWAC